MGTTNKTKNSTVDQVFENTHAKHDEVINKEESRSNSGAYHDINTSDMHSGYRAGASVKTHTKGRADLNKIFNAKNAVKISGTASGFVLGRVGGGGLGAGIGMVVGGPIGAGIGYGIGAVLGEITGAVGGNKVGGFMIDKLHISDDSVIEGTTDFDIKTEATGVKEEIK